MRGESLTLGDINYLKVTTDRGFERIFSVKINEKDMDFSIQQMISYLSKVSLLLTIISLSCFLTAQILRIESIGQVLIYISLTISFIALTICIINLFRKNIKKKLSNILLVIKGIYVGFFLLIVLVIALLSPVK